MSILTTIKEVIKMLNNKEKNIYPKCNHDNKHFDNDYICVYMRDKTFKHIRRDSICHSYDKNGNKKYCF